MAPGGAGHEPGDSRETGQLFQISAFHGCRQLMNFLLVKYEHIQNKKSGGTSGAQSARIHADSEQGSFLAEHDIMS
jgi:hypothetical protein